MFCPGLCATSVPTTTSSCATETIISAKHWYVPVLHVRYIFELEYFFSKERILSYSKKYAMTRIRPMCFQPIQVWPIAELFIRNRESEFVSYYGPFSLSLFFSVMYLIAFKLCFFCHGHSESKSDVTEVLFRPSRLL